MFKITPMFADIALLTERLRVLLSVKTARKPGDDMVQFKVIIPSTFTAFIPQYSISDRSWEPSHTFLADTKEGFYISISSDLNFRDSIFSFGGMRNSMARDESVGLTNGISGRLANWMSHERIRNAFIATVSRASDAVKSFTNITCGSRKSDVAHSAGKGFWSDWSGHVNL